MGETKQFLSQQLKLTVLEVPVLGVPRLIQNRVHTIEGHKEQKYYTVICVTVN